jgi:hypothetical protein
MAWRGGISVEKGDLHTLRIFTIEPFVISRLHISALPRR